MKVVRTFCDFCKKEFASTYWDEQPSTLLFKLGSPPAQSGESFEVSLGQVCRGCRTELRLRVRQVLSDMTMPDSEAMHSARGNLSDASKTDLPGREE